MVTLSANNELCSPLPHDSRAQSLPGLLCCSRVSMWASFAPAASGGAHIFDSSHRRLVSQRIYRHGSMCGMLRRKLVSQGIAVSVFCSLLEADPVQGMDKLPFKQEGYNFWTWKGHKIHYVEQGSGRPVVLIHGFGASAFHWRYNIPELAKKYKVYAIDLLGFGWSEKAIIEYDATVWRDQVSEFMKEIVREPAILVGNSLGGFTALFTAAELPQQVLGVVLLNSAGQFGNTSGPSKNSNEETVVKKFIVNPLKETFQRIVLGFLFWQAKQPARIESVLKSGSLDDFSSLVEAIKQVDVVICAVPSKQVLEQKLLIQAIKEAGCITRFIPSEFGADPDKVHINKMDYGFYEKKAEIRRFIENEDIPCTYISCNFLTRYLLPSLVQPGLKVPPRDKIKIFGDGNTKAVFVKECDVATFTISTIDDPKTLNKVLYLRPPGNVVSMNELVEMWEVKIGQKLEKIHISEEQLLESIQDTPFPSNMDFIFIYSAFIKGDHTYFSIDQSGLDGTELYSHVKYTTVRGWINNARFHIIASPCVARVAILCLLVF